MKHTEKKLKTIQECIDLHYINDEDFIEIYEFNDSFITDSLFGAKCYNGKAKYAHKDYHVLKIIHYNISIVVIVMPLEKEKTPFIDWE